MYLIEKLISSVTLVKYCDLPFFFFWMKQEKLSWKLWFDTGVLAVAFYNACLQKVSCFEEDLRPDLCEQ